MANPKKLRKCLICSASVTECRVGIDACRACAVFYKRNRATKLESYECMRGDGKCLENGVVTTCRKCRYERFTEVLRRANASHKEDNLTVQTHMVTDQHELQRLDERRRRFIDHTTFLLDQPSCSTTPLLDKIRWSYSLLCQTRKSAEAGTKSVGYHLNQGDYEGLKIRFVPVTYSMIGPNERIFQSALYDFANMTFPDFAKLDTAKKKLCIHSSLQLVTFIDALYRAEHHFPNDLDTNFASYTTTVSEESLQSFFDDCPSEKHKQEAIEVMETIKGHIRLMNRDCYHRVKPDDVEFTALLGLAFWNNAVAYMNDELSNAMLKYRAAIMQELHGVYKACGRADYATRLGELFCLLDTMHLRAPVCIKFDPTSPSTSSGSERILERIGRVYNDSVERRRMREKALIDENQPIVPHPTETIYLSNYKSSNQTSDICVAETRVFFQEAFPSLADLSTVDRDLLFKAYVAKFSLIDSLYRTREIWGEVKRYSMDSIHTCFDHEGTDEWLGDEKEWQSRYTLLESIRNYLSIQKGFILPIFNKTEISSTELYALLGLLLCEIDASEDVSDKMLLAIDDIRRDVLADLQRHYKASGIVDISTRLGNIMTLSHAIRECESLFTEFYRMHSTVFDLYASEQLKELFL